MVPKPDFYDAEGHGSQPRRQKLLPREHLTLQLLKPHLNTRWRFLDVGCGDGFFLTTVQASVPDIELFGIDRSAHQLARAEAVLNRADLRNVDLDQGIPLEDQALDIVYAGEMSNTCTIPICY